MYRGINQQNNENLYTWTMALLIGLYFLFSSLDYIAKITGGASFLRVLGIGIYAVSIFHYILRRTITIAVDRKMMLYLMIFPFIACLWAVNSSTGYSRAFTIFTTLLVTFFAIDIEFDEKQINLIENLAILGAIIVGVLLIKDQGLSAFLSGGRIYLSGSKDTSDPNGMAARFLMPLLISFKKTEDSKKIWKKMIYVIDLLFILLLFFMCGSRGGLVALVVSGIIYIFRQTRGDVSGRLKALIAILIIVIILLVFAEDILPEYIYHRLFTADSYSGSGSRTYIWKAFLQKIYLDSPIIGFGTYGVYYKLGEQLGYSLYAMHNSYLCMIGEYGIFYLPVFLAFIHYIKKRAIYANRAILNSILAGICVAIFFLDGYETKYFWNMILYISLVCNFCEYNESKFSNV